MHPRSTTNWWYGASAYHERDDNETHPDPEPRRTLSSSSSTSSPIHFSFKKLYPHLRTRYEQLTSSPPLTDNTELPPYRHDQEVTRSLPYRTPKQRYDPTMAERSLNRARIVSSVAATLISLACGTNYVYSAWGPQFAQKLKLSSTEQNLIGLSGNLGMYSLGIPVGMLVDAKGPRLAVVLGCFLLGIGYFALHTAYNIGSGSVPVLCFFSYLSGLGGCGAFAAAIKTSALNWPHHRGTATAFPLAAFGLSAFFFSTFFHLFLSGGTGEFLMLLAGGTFGIVFVGLFFLRVLPHSHYSSVPTTTRDTASRLHRTKSEDSKNRAQQVAQEPGRSSFNLPPVPLQDSQALNQNEALDRDTTVQAPSGSTSETDETSSLMSSRSSTSSARDVLAEENNVKDHAHRVDIRGLNMLPYAEFWHLFALMGILTGVGLMTINNIGNDANALWRHYDDSVLPDFIARRQALHVSILSIFSFIGRLCSGLGSDFLAKVLKASRLWCLTIASLIFLVAQIFALNVQTPYYLSIVSSLTGLAYGFLFGCFPSLVAEAFGIHGLSTNWGCMTLSPIISGNVFNLFYGMVFDRHSILKPDGERECTEGLACYRDAYMVTVVACVVGLVLSLWSIYYTHAQREKEEKELEASQAERVA